MFQAVCYLPVTFGTTSGISHRHKPVSGCMLPGSGTWHYFRYLPQTQTCVRLYVTWQRHLALLQVSPTDADLCQTVCYLAVTFGTTSGISHRHKPVSDCMLPGSDT
ncbi:uncharacterized protein LOC124256681 [Haliotis rubra]|uniref:uncharacterized protein LOC124256681 n=1 Tax=Haliotis rubra TaxID=36100 RepID=UPI001EE4F214|nr:uncharacterized protein LOC124256681 [Haliotis rubra]